MPDYSADIYRCEYEAYGERCMNRGTFKASTNGSGKWMCWGHLNCKSSMEGVEIIKDSLKPKTKPEINQGRREGDQ